MLSPDIEEYPLDEGLEVDSIDTSSMSPSRSIYIDATQRVWLESHGPTADDLLRCRYGRWMPVTTRGLTRSAHHPQQQLTRTSGLRLPPGKMTWVIKQGVAKVCRGGVADQVGVRAVHVGRSPRAYSSPPGIGDLLPRASGASPTRKTRKRTRQ